MKSSKKIKPEVGHYVRCNVEVFDANRTIYKQTGKIIRVNSREILVLFDSIDVHGHSEHHPTKKSWYLSKRNWNNGDFDIIKYTWKTRYTK